MLGDNVFQTDIVIAFTKDEWEWVFDVFSNYTQITGLAQAKTYISILEKFKAAGEGAGFLAICPNPPGVPLSPPASLTPAELSVEQHPNRRRSGGGA